MWLMQKAKNATKTVLQYSQTVLQAKTQSTPCETLLLAVLDNKLEIVPVEIMSQLCEVSYDMACFEELVKSIATQSTQFQYNNSKAKQTLNLLVLIAYLIKNGAGGFIDQMRGIQQTFQGYRNIQLKNTEDNAILKLAPVIEEIRERAIYVMQLLSDNRLLMRQKQIAMAIRQRIKITAIKGISYGAQSISSPPLLAPPSRNLDQFLENYFWRYKHKIEGKIEDIVEQAVGVIEEYFLENKPQAFQIDQPEQVVNHQEVTVVTTDSSTVRPQEVNLLEMIYPRELI